MGRGWGKRSSSEDRRRGQTPAQRYLGLQRLCVWIWTTQRMWSLMVVVALHLSDGCLSFIHPSIKKPPCTSKRRLSFVTNFYFPKKIKSVKYSIVSKLNRQYIFFYNQTWLNLLVDDHQVGKRKHFIQDYS
jgi:hypothetical protein